MLNTIIFSYFPPAYKVGGPVRSVYNIAQLLRHTSVLHILTPKRDLDGSVVNYKSINNIDVIPYNNFSVIKVLKICIYNKKIDNVYLNNLFNIEHLLISIFLKFFFNTRIIVSPRGQLMKGALEIKAQKKNIYINCFLRFFFSYVDVLHFTSDQEYQEFNILNLPHKSSVHILSNLSSLPFDERFFLNTQKNSGDKIKLIFYSRIVSKKNLDILIKYFLKLNDDKFVLHIYGIIEDEIYFNNCMNLIGNNTNIIYCGSVSDKDNLQSILNKYDLFILLTKAENFGHVIVEALYSGLPLLLSHNTPFTSDLINYSIGFSINQNSFDEFKKSLYDIFNGDNNYKLNIFNYVKSIEAKKRILQESYIKLFLNL